MPFWRVEIKTPLVSVFPTSRFVIFYINIPYLKTLGHAVLQLVEALPNKPEVGGFDS